MPSDMLIDQMEEGMLQPHTDTVGRMQMCIVFLGHWFIGVLRRQCFPKLLEDALASQWPLKRVNGERRV